MYIFICYQLISYWLARYCLIYIHTYIGLYIYRLIYTFIYWLYPRLESYRHWVWKNSNKVARSLLELTPIFLLSIIGINPNFPSSTEYLAPLRVPN